jgi:iron(III) transport system substrate-binding protein
MFRLLPFVLIVPALLFASGGSLSAGVTPTAPVAASPTATVELPQVTGRLVIYSGRSEPLIQPALEAFQARYPQVEILLKSGKNSDLANALLEERANPQADVFITTEMITVQTMHLQGVLGSYRPAGADRIPAEFLGPEDSWVGLTRRARAIMVNTDLVSPAEAPRSIFDLTDSRWQGQVAAAGSTNGSMQAQIAAMRQLLGDDETEAWLRGLLDNQVTFFGSHTDVRKAVGAGEFRVGLVNHYYYYLQKAEGSPVAIVFPDQGDDQIGLISNATAAAIVKGARNVPAAQRLLDFLVSSEGQPLFAELNYEYPLVADVAAHPDVEPLAGLRLAEVDVAAAALDIDATFALMEKVGLP